MAKKLIKSRRRKATGGFLDKIRQKHLTQEDRELNLMRRELEIKIPDTEKRLAYIKAMAEHCIITCEVCEDKEKCLVEYKDCKFNPVNGG